MFGSNQIGKWRMSAMFSLFAITAAVVPDLSLQARADVNHGNISVIHFAPHTDYTNLQNKIQACADAENPQIGILFQALKGEQASELTGIAAEFNCNPGFYGSTGAFCSSHPELKADGTSYWTFGWTATVVDPPFYTDPYLIVTMSNDYNVLFSTLREWDNYTNPILHPGAGVPGSGVLLPSADEAPIVAQYLPAGASWNFIPYLVTKFHTESAGDAHYDSEGNYVPSTMVTVVTSLEVHLPGNYADSVTFENVATGHPISQAVSFKPFVDCLKSLGNNH